VAHNKVKSLGFSACHDLTLSKLRPGYAPSANYSTYRTLPAMSQSDFPEHFPFALDASFLPRAPGLICPDPGKMPPSPDLGEGPGVRAFIRKAPLSLPKGQPAGRFSTLTAPSPGSGLPDSFSILLLLKTKYAIIYL